MKFCRYALIIFSCSSSLAIARRTVVSASYMFFAENSRPSHAYSRASVLIQLAIASSLPLKSLLPLDSPVVVDRADGCAEAVTDGSGEVVCELFFGE